MEWFESPNGLFGFGSHGGREREDTTMSWFGTVGREEAKNRVWCRRLLSGFKFNNISAFFCARDSYISALIS